MLAYYEDWESGHSPVSTGRAPWLPAPFVQAMHATRSLIAVAKTRRLERERDRARIGREPVLVKGRQAHG